MKKLVQSLCGVRKSRESAAAYAARRMNCQRKGAVKIQSKFRGDRNRALVRSKAAAEYARMAISNLTHPPIMGVSRNLSANNKNRAARIIQKSARGKMLEEKARQAVVRNRAARTIQRQMAPAPPVTPSPPQRTPTPMKKNKAARVIQRVRRGQVGRLTAAELRKQKVAMAAVEAAQLRSLSRKNKAVRKIQAMARLRKYKRTTSGPGVRVGAGSQPTQLQAQQILHGLQTSDGQLDLNTITDRVGRSAATARTWAQAVGLGVLGAGMGLAMRAPDVSAGIAAASTILEQGGQVAAQLGPEVVAGSLPLSEVAPKLVFEVAQAPIFGIPPTVFWTMVLPVIVSLIDMSANRYLLQRWFGEGAAHQYSMSNKSKASFKNFTQQKSASDGPKKANKTPAKNAAANRSQKKAPAKRAQKNAPANRKKKAPARAPKRGPTKAPANVQSSPAGTTPLMTMRPVRELAPAHLLANAVAKRPKKRAPAKKAPRKPVKKQVKKPAKRAAKKQARKKPAKRP